MNPCGLAYGLRLVALAAASAFLVVGVSACCKSGSDDDKCPRSYAMLSAEEKAGEATCNCDASSVARGSVWGDGIYTADSSICRAAVHAGTIPTAGGAVTVKSAPGCDAYVGAEKNGVKSSKWGSFGTSFYFPGKGDGKCAVMPKAAATKCPRNFKSIPGVNADTSITCVCDSSQTGSGSVWGTDIYTQDSSICRAAVHAGALSPSGGSVSAKAAPGCKTYSGRVRNGVSSSKWGSYDASFYFPAKGNGACL